MFTDTLMVFLGEIAAHAAYDVSKSSLLSAVKYVANKRPDLELAADTATSREQLQQTLDDAVGFLVAEADRGSIVIDGTLLSALRGIQFDHQHGLVTIGNSTLSAAVLITGGSPGASGETHILGNTVMQSRGTRMSIGPTASARITGGASIRQN